MQTKLRNIKKACLRIRGKSNTFSRSECAVIPTFSNPYTLTDDIAEYRGSELPKKQGKKRYAYTGNPQLTLRANVPLHSS